MGQKAKPDFVARMGSFDDAECFDAFVRMRMHQAWSSAMILLMGWKLTNDQPWTCRRSTPSCRGIGWGYQRGRGQQPGRWTSPMSPWNCPQNPKRLTKAKATGNHQPPTHCPKWPRSGCSNVSRREIYPLSVFKWSTLVFHIRNIHMLPQSCLKVGPKGSRSPLKSRSYLWHTMWFNA